MSLMIEDEKCSLLVMEDGDKMWKSKKVFKAFCSAERLHLLVWVKYRKSSEK